MAYTDKPLRPLRVFLCHSSADKPAVRELYRRLRNDGFEPWLDEEDLIPGQDWQHEIPKVVKNSDVVIVCLSRGSVNKAGYVQKEIRLALDAADEQPEGTIFIIPLKLEECKVPERLSRWQWVNYFAESGHRKLLRALHTRVESLEVGVVASLQPSEPSKEKRPIQPPNPVIINQPGGTNVEADQVHVGQDITGRDKIVSAGGHIIHAESGATVVINEHPIVSTGDRTTQETTEPESQAQEQGKGARIVRVDAEQGWLARVNYGFEPIPFDSPEANHPYNYALAPTGTVLLGKEKIPFNLLEHQSGQGHRVIEVQPTHAGDQAAKDIRPAEIQNVVALYVLLSAGDAHRTRSGERFEAKEIGRLIIQFYGNAKPQIVPLRLGIEIREWVSGETRLGYDVVSSASVAEEVWQSPDHRHTLDMIRVNIDGGPKDVLNLSVVADCKWLPETYRSSLPSIRISGVTYQIAQPNSKQQFSEVTASVETERIAREKEEQEGLAKENAEQDRLAQERAEAKRLAALKAEEERIARTKVEQEKQLINEEPMRRQLVDARKNLRLIKEQEAKYFLETEIPLQLIKEERRLRERIVELEQIIAQRENLRLIEEQKAKYVLETDIPLQLIIEERRLRERIAELA